MKILIVFAHPESASFCGALGRQAVQSLSALGHGVVVSDLYADGFDPRGGPHDFTHASDHPFNYQTEQRRAAGGCTFARDIAEQQRRVIECDALLLNFPMWWYGPPAILKGWIDRVLAAGFAYDRDRKYATGPLAGRAGMVTVTTGSPAERYTDAGDRPFLTMDQLLLPLQAGLFHYTGMKTVDPFVAYAAGQVDAGRRKACLADYHAHLTQNFGAG